MSERGVFAVDRGIWSDPDFADEQFSEREAFLWLISEAAWRPCKVRIGHHQIDLARGQCAFSTRFMADKWGWSEARVRRFLKRLISAEIVCTRTDKIATHISILKYDRFQRVSLPDAEIPTHTRRTCDAPPTHLRRKEEDKEYKEGIQLSSLRSAAEWTKRTGKRTSASLDWVIDAPEYADAEKAGLSAAEAEGEWPQFIDHHLKDKTLFADWPAAWRTWCRNFVKFRARRQQRQPQSARRQSTPDFWASESISGNHNLTGGQRDTGPFHGDTGPGDRPGGQADGRPHRAVSQSPGGDTGRLPALQLVRTA